TWPSTRTSPSASRRSATARERTAGSEARYRSSRIPAASSGTRRFTHLWRPRPLGRHQREQQDRDPDGDEAVGEVERRPVLQVEKVRDVTEPHTVDEIRDAASDDEPERDRQHRVTRAGPAEEVEHPEHRNAGEQD